MTSENVASLAKQVGLRVSDDGALWGHARALESFARQTIDPYQAEVHLLRAQRDALLEACRTIVQAFDALPSGDSARMARLQINAARAAIKKAEEA